MAEDINWWVASNEVDKLPWDRRRRLEFIEFLLYWEQRLKPIQLHEYFRISEEQGRKDLKDYARLTERALSGGGSASNLVETGAARARGYEAAEAFGCRFIEPDFDDYALFYGSGGKLTWSPQTAEPYAKSRLKIVRLPVLKRRPVDPRCARAVLQAIDKGQALIIDYLSPRFEEARTIRLVPSFLAYDGSRWHVRAYVCDRNGGEGAHRDIVLERLRLDAAPAYEERGFVPKDRGEDEITVRITPNPGLKPHERANIAAQYLEMADGVWRLPIRRSLVPYFLKRYQLEEDSLRKSPHQEPLAVAERPRLSAEIEEGWRVPQGYEADPLRPVITELRRRRRDLKGLGDCALILKALNELLPVGDDASNTKTERKSSVHR